MRSFYNHGSTPRGGRERPKASHSAQHAAWREDMQIGEEVGLTTSTYRRRREERPPTVKASSAIRGQVAGLSNHGLDSLARKVSARQHPAGNAAFNSSLVSLEDSPSCLQQTVNTVPVSASLDADRTLNVKDTHLASPATRLAPGISEAASEPAAMRSLVVQGIPLRPGAAKSAQNYVKRLLGGKDVTIVDVPYAPDGTPPPSVFVTFTSRSAASEVLHRIQRDARSRLNARWCLAGEGLGFASRANIVSGTSQTEPPGLFLTSGNWGPTLNSPSCNGVAVLKRRRPDEFPIAEERFGSTDQRPSKRLATGGGAEPTIGIMVHGFARRNSKCVADLEDDLRQLCAPFGVITSLKIPHKSITAWNTKGRPAVYGFARYVGLDEARTAFESINRLGTFDGVPIYARYDMTAPLSTSLPLLNSTVSAAPRRSQPHPQPMLEPVNLLRDPSSASPRSSTGPAGQSAAPAFHRSGRDAGKISPSIKSEDAEGSTGMVKSTSCSRASFEEPAEEHVESHQTGIDDYGVDNTGTGPEQYRTFEMPDECRLGQRGFQDRRTQFKRSKILELARESLTVLDVEFTTHNMCKFLVVKAPAESSSAALAHETSDVSLRGTDGPQISGAESDSAAKPAFPLRQPEVAYIHGTSEFRESLGTFLAVFFRLFEESRTDAMALYSDSAVFSNALAGQGCKPSGVTKLRGRKDILASLSRLPPLSHDSPETFIVDAFRTSTSTDQAFCAVKGSFVEFPSGLRRSFDRNLLLVPAEGTATARRLYSLNWVISSDILIVRRFTEPAGLVRTLRDASPTPPSQRIIAAHDTDIGHDAGTEAGVAPQPPPRPVPGHTAALPLEDRQEVEGSSDLERLAGQLAALQSEVEKLKKGKSRALHENVGAFPATLTPSESEPEARPNGINEAASFVTRGVRTGQALSAKSLTHSTRGLGGRKRVLLPTGKEGNYLGVCFRGEIFAAYRHRGIPGLEPVELLKASPSAMQAHTVDAAICHRDTLIVGYYGDKSAPPTSQVSVSRLKRGSGGGITIDREPLSARPHERGVISLCLLPDGNDGLRFVSGGHGPKVTMWSLNRDYTECSDILTGHTSAIQSLYWNASRAWLLSAGADRKFLGFSLEAQKAVFTIKNEGRCNQIVTNPDDPHSAMVVSANDASHHFKVYDLRAIKANGRPARTFGLPLRADAPASLSVYRKGAAKSNSFAFAGVDDVGGDGVRIWDLRNLKSAILEVGKSAAIQPVFEGSSRLVVLEKDDVTWLDLH